MASEIGKRTHVAFGRRVTVSGIGSGTSLSQSKNHITTFQTATFTHTTLLRPTKPPPKCNFPKLSRQRAVPYHKPVEFFYSTLASQSSSSTGTIMAADDGPLVWIDCEACYSPPPPFRVTQTAILHRSTPY